jgi:hypothetical protein
MTREAIYAWRNRVGKLVRRFATELRASGHLAVARPAAGPANGGHVGEGGRAAERGPLQESVPAGEGKTLDGAVRRRSPLGTPRDG